MFCTDNYADVFSPLTIWSCGAENKITTTPSATLGLHP